jgi:hypothetical protein
MADKVETKLQGLSGERTAKVKQIKALQAKLRKAGTDAEAKRINNEIKALNAERTRIETEYNNLSDLKTTAKEYTSLNKSLENLNKSLASAQARGEDTSSIKSQINKATSRISVIAPEVESNFPELKLAAKATATPSVAPTFTGFTPAVAATPAPKPTRTPTPTPTPKPKPAKPATSVDPGTPEERIKESTGNAGGGKDTGTADAEATATALNAANTLGLAQSLFEHVPSLKTLLDNYVKQGWTNTRFLQELRNDTWYKQNSDEIKKRYIQLYNYQDQVATGNATGSTDYEKQIRTLKDQVLAKARMMGSGLASDPAKIQQVAENMYITNTSIDDMFTTQLIAAAIRPIGSTIAGKPTQGYSGQALLDYKVIQDAAAANGFTVADIIPGGSNEQQVLQGLATGALDLERIKQDARRLAAQGQPQYVRDLLGQGYNLDQVYAPYRQTMANILEIGDAKQISLNDPTLRMAITDKGDMNLYDFKKALRQDNRWQYTDTAKQEVSTAALSVLRDFGFQG